MEGVCLTLKKVVEILLLPYNERQKKINYLLKISSTSVKGSQKSSEDFDLFCSRALTLPKNVTLKKSSVDENQYGIWSTMKIPKGVRFGPYEGILVIKNEDKTYSKMLEDKPVVHFENNLNWLCHINFASCQELQNLVALQYDGQIYYDTVRDIPPDTELLVCYGDNLTEGDDTDDDNGVSNNSVSQGNKNRKVKIRSKVQQNNSFLTSDEQRETDKTERVSVDNEESNTSVAVTPDGNLQLHLKENKCVCDKKFANNSELEEHVKTCTVGKNNSAMNSIPQKRIRTYTNRLPCDMCDKTYKQKSDLIEHRRSHTGEKPYICDFCGKMFSRKSSYKVHLTTHTAEKQKVCNICGKRFLRNSELHQHQFVHMAIKSHVCDFCGKPFKSSIQLKEHRRLHTQEPRYGCDTCGKQFYIKYSLKQHMLIHTGEKRYTCDVCGKRFVQKSGLSTHKRIHMGEDVYICEVCGTRLSSNSTLQRHMLRHKGEKPHICNLCGKRFSRKYYLTQVHRCT